MRLRLAYPPIPENAARFAGSMVEAARNIDGIELDYSPGSLAEVDRIFERFRKERADAGRIAETVFGFGCYVGEVLVRQLGGAWKMPDPATPFGAEGANTMIVELPNGSEWNPIGKASKVLENGETDSVAYFYAVASKVAK